MDIGKIYLPDFPVIHPWARQSMGPALQATGRSFTGTSSAAWLTANKAFFMPFSLSRPFLIKKLFAYNGSAVSGNIDVGIYDRTGVRLVSSGSTAQAGTNALQVFDVTDILIGPGLFYMAVALDNTTGTIFRTLIATSGEAKNFGMLQQTSAFPLPTVATFATATSADAHMVGLTKRTVI